MNSLPDKFLTELEDPFAITNDHIDFFNLNGFIKIKNVLSAGLIHYINEIITAEVDRLNIQTIAIEERDTYGKAFLQIMNIWTKSAAAKQIVFSKRLAGMATDLMCVNGVRMYHDQALFKEPGGGFTPWHADQYYWPLSTHKTVTAWIPLQRTGMEMGPLEFSCRSQSMQEGRTLKISDDSETIIQQKLQLNDFEKTAEPFDMGEISFHMGWTFHRAGANTGSLMRKVMTIIYMDKEMRLKTPENENQLADWHEWCPGAVVGEVIDTKLNPVIFEKQFNSKI